MTNRFFVIMLFGVLLSQPCISAPLDTLSETHQQAFRSMLVNLEKLQSNEELLDSIILKDVKARLLSAEENKKQEAKILQLKLKLVELQRRQDDTRQRIDALNAALSLLNHTADTNTAAESESTTAITSPRPKSHLDTPKQQEEAVVKAVESKGDLFTHSVKPILDNKCAICHEGNTAKGGFNLLGQEWLTQGGKSGAAIVPGDAEKSLLYQMVAGITQPYMPFQLPRLSDEEVAAIRDWINTGAKITESKEGSDIADFGSRQITDAERRFWSYQPLQIKTPPVAEETRWNRSPIDQFVYAKMKEQGLHPAERADKLTLIRRVYYDMIGLPPAPDEVKAFLDDESPEAYEKLIDRLLESPHYGERWGRHWLDLARYADSGGYEFDVERPHAYPYRDFVIQALNQDMPYDQFIRWQMAGDEYAPENPLARAATGFCTNGPTISNQKLEINRYDELDDILSTTISTTLGLTIACARCHDHKYDAITQKDYYQLLAVFTSSKRDLTMIGKGEEFEAYQKAKRSFDEKHDQLKQQIDQIQHPVRERIRKQKLAALNLNDEQRWLLNQPNDKTNQAQQELRERVKRETEVFTRDVERELSAMEKQHLDRIREELREWEEERPHDPTKALTLTDPKAEPVTSYFLTRGNPALKAGEIEPGFLQVLTNEKQSFQDWMIQKAEPRTTLRRSALAEWILDAEQGAGHLTARVMVNRLWHYHFGRGIVSTPSDFGVQGERPSHPALLDWLAHDFIKHGWKIKRMHKHILMSETYRQNTAYHPENHNRDPENRYLWHRRPKRLEAEVIRDAMLFVSGKLNPEMFGRGVYPWMHPDAVATGSTKKWPTDAVDNPETWRRSVYVNIRRSVLMPMFQVYDMPDTTAGCSKRMVTTIAPQALFLLNNKFSRDQSTFFARRVMQSAGMQSAGGTLEDRIREAYWHSLSRPPLQPEINDAIQFMAGQANRYKMLDQDFQIGFQPVLHHPAPDQHVYLDRAFVDFCQVLYNLNEFIYVD